uniref:hypothetical protein n=1 Tax=Rickettsia endosymbiont of Ixodes pacificus TaxID=1133329 RepID=UPI00067A5A34|nr:hypothetical protein [Rickettsia endosymbiont of Ixodes pacificus]AKS10399.1 hypothetical protein REIP_p505 [Rickettsia endosymbiont of Ixodes pacificus]
MSQDQRLQNEFKVAPQVELLSTAEDKRQVNVIMIAILLSIFLIGCCTGYFSTHVFGNDLDRMQVVYVSRSEIMDLEKARLEREQDPEGRMFFGKINKAIDLIRKEAFNYEDDYHRLIFVGDNYVEGKNTKSISKIVYVKVMSQLGGKTNARKQTMSNYE